MHTRSSFRAESQPLTLKQCLPARRPILGTIHARNGRINLKAFTAAIQDIICNPSLWARYCANAICSARRDT